MFDRTRLRRIGSLLGLILVLVGCTESDTQLFDQIGVSRLYLVDPGLGPQSAVLTPAEQPAQTTTWDVTSAILDVEGTSTETSPEIAEGGCQFVAVSDNFTLGSGICQVGLVLDASNEPLELKLTLVVAAMEVRRARPEVLLLGPSDDFDGDGIQNDRNQSGSAFDRPCGLFDEPDCDDNCPFAPNDQTDDNGDGIGNACTILDVFQGVILDSDGDGVRDTQDNCVFETNADQADTSGPMLGDPPQMINDQIGDDCEEQIAPVRVNGSTSFTLTLGPTDLSQPTALTTFITVDFDSSRALDCDWDSLSCTLAPSEVRFCTSTSAFVANLGCF